MKVYKATKKDMTCSMGAGIFQYHLGIPAKAEESKCGNTGLHACEYVLDCLRYYGLGGGNRFFEAEADGDIAEDGQNTRISCTELTLTRELTNRDIAREAIRYMTRHPKREGWQHSSSGVTVAAEEAGTGRDGIAIARGTSPKAKGGMGAQLGWIRETPEGIREGRLVTVSGPIKPDTWYTIEEAEEAIRREKIETEKNTGSAG